jgi:hypothetical protein
VSQTLREKKLSAKPSANGHAAHPAQPRELPAIVSRSLAEIEYKEVRWIWPGWVPAGMLSILDGDPSDGKSTITIDIAARYSRGRMMPECKELSADAGGVLFLAAEDSAEHTIKPRAEAAGADTKLCRVSECLRIGDHERPIRMPDDIQAVEREIIAHKIGLVIIDPLLGFLSQAVDSHKDASVRDVLHEFKLLAERTGAAVLGLRHLTKGGAGNPLYRGMGSIAITASARSAFTVAAHPNEDGVRVMASTKLNIGKPPRSVRYRIEDYCGYPTIVWDGHCDLTAKDLGAVPPRGDGNALAEACDLLRDVLADGPKPQAEVKSQADARGVKWPTLRRAADSLKVVSEKVGFVGKWMWKLPTPEDAQAGNAPEGAHEDAQG